MRSLWVWWGEVAEAKFGDDSEWCPEVES